MRAPGALGKPTTIPGASPTPPSSSVPCVETWWELPLQCATGTQLTLVIRTLVTWGEAAFPVAVVEPVPVAAGEAPPLPAGAPAPPASGAPPALDAKARAGSAASRHSNTRAAAAATDLD